MSKCDKHSYVAYIFFEIYWIHTLYINSCGINCSKAAFCNMFLSVEVEVGVVQSPSLGNIGNM